MQTAIVTALVVNLLVVAWLLRRDARGVGDGLLDRVHHGRNHEQIGDELDGDDELVEDDPCGDDEQIGDDPSGDCVEGGSEEWSLLDLLDLG